MYCSAQEPGADALREAGAVTVIVRLLGAVEDSSVKELVIETLSSAAQNGRTMHCRLMVVELWKSLVVV